MPTASVIPAELIAAYRATDFCADIAPGVSVTLRIGEYDSRLNKLQHIHQVKSCAVLTAANPISEPTSDEANCAAQAALIEKLQTLNLSWLPAMGNDPSGKWPGEPSVLVLGISCDQARALAIQFKQNAFVFCDESAIPALHLCR